MFTVCSKCNLRLTVTATDLRAAQGYVRCGRCHNVFNALAALADDPARQAEQTTAADTQSRPALTPPTPEPQPATPGASETAQKPEIFTDTFATDTSLEFNPASTNINEVFIEAAPDGRTGTFESIILGGEEPEEADVVEEQPVLPRRPPHRPPAAGPAVTAAANRSARRRAELAVAAQPPGDDEISFMADWSAPTPSAAGAPGVNAAAATEIADALKATDATRRAPQALRRPQQRRSRRSCALRHAPPRECRAGCHRLPRPCWPWVCSRKSYTTTTVTSPTPRCCVLL